MPKNYSSLLYTVHLVTVIVVNTLMGAFHASGQTNNSGAIAMAVVLAAFVLFMIFKSIQFVNTKEKHLVLWLGLLIIIIVSVLIQIGLKESDYAKYSIVGSILVAFVVNFIGSKYIESKNQ